MVFTLHLFILRPTRQDAVQGFEAVSPKLQELIVKRAFHTCSHWVQPFPASLLLSQVSAKSEISQLSYMPLKNDFPNGKSDWVLAACLRQGEGARLEGGTGTMRSWSKRPCLERGAVNLPEAGDLFDSALTHLSSRGTHRKAGDAAA